MADLDRVRHTASSLVMAEQSVHDVVNQTLSVGDRSPSDVNVDKSIRHATGEESAAGETRTDNRGNEESEQDNPTIQDGETSFQLINGQAHVCPCAFLPDLVRPKSMLQQSEYVRAQPTPEETGISTDGNTQDSDFDGNISRNQSTGDLSAASDNDTRKAEQSSVSEDVKNQDAGNAARRTASFKPVSFAKYSAAKVAGVNSAAKSISDKGESCTQQCKWLLNVDSTIIFCQFVHYSTAARITPSTGCENNERTT
jgi:hypothetical protein